MPRSFSFRLAAAFAGIGISAAALTAILVNVAFGSRFTEYLEERSEARERQLVAALADSYRRVGGWDARDLDDLAPLVLMDGGTLRLEDPAGNAVWEPSEDALGSHIARIHRDMMGTGPLGLERALPVSLEGELVGTAIVRLPQPGLIPADVAFRAEVNRLLVIGGIGAGLVALVLGILLARRAVAPARELTAAARSLASGDRAHRVELESGDEFGEMARAFNSMADSLDEQDRLRRSFAAAVAHELRTPLAILRSHIEAMQDGVLDADPSALASLQDEVLRLSRLVADLETLASAEATGFSLTLQPLSLDRLAANVVTEYRGPYHAAGIRLERDITPTTISADATRLRQVLSNLLSNALKFTPAGGVVRVEVRPDDGWAALRVDDSGPGIPEDDLPYIFDRFFRGRAARTGGSGIGLSVVREIVHAHEGEVSVEATPGRGTSFLVRLPRVSSHPGEIFTATSRPPSKVGERAD